MNTHLGQFLIGAVMVATVAARASTNELVVDGEHFTVRQITDARFNNSVAFHFYAPKDWHDTSEVTWNLRHIARPATIALKVENPANAEASMVFHPLICGYLPGPRAAQFEGKDTADGLSLHPMQPAPALAWFIQKYRSQYPDLKFIGSRDLPGLPKALHVNFGNNQHGIGVKVTYTLDGKPVEEEFYAVHRYTVVQGEALWGLECVHSFRAAAGTLDQRRNVLAAITKSLAVTPEFARRFAAVHQQLAARYKANEQRTYQQIAAAGRMSAANAAQDDAFLKGVDSTLTASQGSSGGPAGGGGSLTSAGNDREDDYIRGVETLNDPSTGDTSQRSFLQQNHWTDGYGNYRDSNDASYNPNNSEVGNWQQMTPAGDQ
jgi:hypothetical protein